MAGSARERRMKAAAKRLALAVACFVVASILATEAYFLIACGRGAPAQGEAFAVEQWAKARGVGYRALEFPSGGNLLRGYLLGGDDARALLVLVHGVSANSDALAPLAMRFAELGYAVMAFDGTAMGRSGGSRTVGIQQARYDAEAAIAYIEREALAGDMPVALIGHSAGAYGAAAALGAAGNAVDAVVCVAGFDAPLDTMRCWARRYAGPLADIEYPFLWLHERLALGADANAAADSALLNARVPALVAQGAADVAIPDAVSLYRDFEGLSGLNVTCALSDDPAHDGHESILRSEDGGANPWLTARIDAFLTEALGLDAPSLAA